MDYITTHYKGPRIVLAAAGGTVHETDPCIVFRLSYLKSKISEHVQKPCSQEFLCVFLRSFS